MQEKDKSLSTVKFLTAFNGSIEVSKSKFLDGEKFEPDWDTCDQRAPVNDPEALYEQFVVPEDIMDELDNEKLEDFDGDIDDYEDRSDLGVDIAAAQDLDLRAAVKNLKSSKSKSVQEEKSESKSAEDIEKVTPDDDE